MEQEVKDQVLNTIKSLGFKNLFVAQAKRADTFFKPRIIVSINDRNLITFNNRGTKITNQFSWLTIKYIGRELDKLRFQFDKVKFAFDFSEEALFRAVTTVLQNILTQSELNAIKFDSFRIPPLQIYPPSSVVNRIIERSNLLKNPIYDNTLETIRSFLIYSVPDIKILDIPGIDKFLSIILDSLPFWSDIQTFSISEMGIIDPYQVTIPYASSFNSFKVLEMNCKKSTNFESFMKELAKSDETQSKKLFTLSFIRSEFEKDELTNLQNFIIEKNIQGLELHDAINRNTMYSFCMHFLSTNMMRSLTILNLDHTKNISSYISMIVPKLSNLLALSLADCDIEVSEVLLYLSRLPKLRILNLSNNTCRKAINGLPPSITTLYLNSVSWCFQTLQLFLTNLPMHHLTLHLADISMQQASDYDDLFKKLPTAKSNFLKGLLWDGNRIEQGLFDFLGMNKSLSFLSLSNCFSDTDEKQVSMLQKYLTQSRSVKKLIIQGTKRKFLGNLVESVISGVLRAPQIEFLDLTQNKGSNLGLSQMRRLITTHTNLQYFLFDRTKPTKYDTFSGFLRDASQNRNLKVSFPIKDMKSMLKKGIINEEQFSQSRSFFMNSSQPEKVYFLFENHDFPRFFSPAEIEELKKPVVDFDPNKQQQQQNQQQKQKEESPKANKTSYNVNYGTYNVKAKAKTDFLGPLNNQQQQQQTKQIFKKQDDDQNQYLLKQNRKIQKMIPKETDNTFDSESASYNNQESSSNDFFIPNNYNNNNEAATVKNRPIRNFNPSTKTKTKVIKKKRTKAASLAPVKKRIKKRLQEPNENDNDNNNQRQTNNTVRRVRKTRSNASQQRPKTARRPTQTNQNIFDDDDYDKDIQINKTPKSTKNRNIRSTTSGTKKNVRRQTHNVNYNDDDNDYDNDIDYENDDHNEVNVRPLLRTKKNARNRRIRETFNDNENDDDVDDQEEEDHLLITYQQPTWNFPIKMKYVYETDTAKKIEDRYSNNSFAAAILNEINERERPKQRKHYTNKKKIVD